jgi:hypothetical protein
MHERHLERQAHTTLYKQETEARLSEVESTLLEKIALVGAKSSKSVDFLKDIGTMTSLTQKQIRGGQETGSRNCIV